MKAPRTPNILRYIPEGAPTIEPAENAHLGLSVPEIVARHGRISRHMAKAIHVFPSMVKALSNVLKSYRSLGKNPPTGPVQADDAFLRALEAYARSLGCDAIGYTQVPTSYIFGNRKLLYDQAIVVTMDMSKVAIDQAPSIAAGKEVWRTYAGLGLIVNRLARFLRRGGYAAQAGPALGGEANYPLLALKAGLGHIGRHGLLISEHNGPSQRIAAVYTNIANLLYTDSDRYDWIPSFCDTCLRCVRKCPASAIYFRPIVFEDGSEQHIDYRKCAVPFSQTMGCSVCVKECTFTRQPYADIKASYDRRLARDRGTDR